MPVIIDVTVTHHLYADTISVTGTLHLCIRSIQFEKGENKGDDELYILSLL
jgi:hypothetical protein